MGTRVFIGRLNYDVRERDLERFFKGYGRIREILMKNGFGFVEFEDYRDADDAVYELNGKELLGERVSVEIARGPSRNRSSYDRDSWRRPQSNPRRSSNSSKYGPPTRTEYRVIVENLSSRVSWQDLKDFMRQAGEVTYADAHKQRRNEGVVEFASRSDMKNAIEKLNKTELNGRRIKMLENRSSRRRSRSRSRSRSSRSRSGSRSRSASRRCSMSKSRSRSVSKSPSRSKSRESPKQTREESASYNRDGAQKKKKSRSKSPSRSKSRSASRSVSSSPEPDA